MREESTVVSIDSVSKSFVSRHRREALHVLDKLSLRVSDGEFVVVFGPNGCGKTTLFRIIADLAVQDEGHVFRRWTLSGSHERLGVVFQNYAESLLPWATAISNVGFPLLAQPMSASRAQEVATAMLRKVGATFDPRQYPYQLSGGEKQLCCLARALVHEPQILLLDEPFGSLDIQVRHRMQAMLLDIWRERRLSVVMISHDLDEAILLASRFILLGKRPSSVKLDIQIDLPYPRDAKLVETIAFFELRTSILKHIRMEMRT
jgi:ABC-type nitrate/sulfonate/bicarbonate transport system ATPase subunit